jgi:hypothetical protein
MFSFPRLLMASALAVLLSISATAQISLSDSPPAELLAPAGTVIAVQVRDHISSDKTTVGDSFVGVLQQPLVIDGWIVSRPGQTVMGQITSANSAGRVKGTSDLAIELTEIVLVNGYQAPIRTHPFIKRGQDSRSEDIVTIAGIAGLGTAIGAAAGGGKGALIGAGIGAGAATAGVLATRGKSADVYPETTLTFRLDTPLLVSTARSQKAFLPVAPADYNTEPILKVPARPDREPDSPEFSQYPRFPR